MKPDPSSESDENQPSRRKGGDPEKVNNGPSEADLWDLSDDGDLKPYQPPGKKANPPNPLDPETRDDEVAPNAIVISPRSTRRDVMTFTQNQPKKSPLERRNPLSDPPAQTPKPPAPASTQKVEPAFDDLEGPPEVAPTPTKPRTSVLKPAVAEKAAEEIPSTPPSIEETEIESEWDLDEEIQPPSAPESSRPSVIEKPAENFSEELEPIAPLPTATTPEPPATPKKPLTGIERIGLISFLVLLIAGGAFLLHSIYKLPETQKPLSSSDFPIKGAKIEVAKATTYWRAPIAGTDTFRRGTVLLPITELQVTGGPAAVRLFFRNSAGNWVGDAETRAINGPTTLKIAATGGFDDLGMHAAYRAGSSEPWIVELREGPSTSAPGDQFKKLFELPISTERR